MFTYDLTTAIGQVRLLIPDRSGAAYMFEDDELTAFLSLEADDVRCAAALALETMAADEAYIQKATTILEITTNGPAVAKALLDRAALLRSQSAALSTEDEFDWAEMVTGPFSARERLEAEALRDA